MSSEQHTPPKLAQKFLNVFLRSDLFEEVSGDLNEKYVSTAEKRSRLRAQINYWYQVFNYFRPFAIRKYRSSGINSYIMYRSYFKVGWRNLLRSKGYSIINIGGLAIGMAVAILNALWVWDEFSVNKNFGNHDRIAQIAETGIDKDGRWNGNTMTYPLGTELITNYNSYFKHIVRSSWTQDYILSFGDKKLSGGGNFVDPAGPEMFTFKMVAGSWNGLKDMNSIMLDQSTARAMFGDDDPINKTIRVNNSFDVTVTGVYEDMPMNSKFWSVEFFSTWDLWLSQNKWIEERAMNDWRNHFIRIYAEILPQYNFESVSEKIKGINKLAPPEPDSPTTLPEVYLYPMSQWHLYPFSHEDNANGTDKGPVRMVWLIASIGAFVLLLACINFMNLSTARSERRAKEVGIRKAIGSLQRQLVQQFFSESFIVVFIAFIFALILSSVCLPWFNDIASKQMNMPWTDLTFWIFGFLFIVITSVLAGSYPALFLSSFKPVKVLKGTFRAGRLASMPRQILVVAQFSISIILIIGTLVVYRQIQFAKARPTGYQRDGLIMIEKKSGDFWGKYDVLRNELKNTGVVEEMSESMGMMTQLWSNNGGWSWEGHVAGENENFGTLAVTHEHGKTVGWQFVKGRDFSREFASDSNGVVINEAFAALMKVPDPSGMEVSWTWWASKEIMRYKVLGVIKDVVMESPYETIVPTIFFIKGFNGDTNWINIRIRDNVSTADALPKIERVFKKLIPSAPFEYKFVDQEYAAKFAAEERIGQLAFIFGTLAIFISCLGLFGLSSFVAEQRTKEIGIRKVVGASVFSLWKLLSKDFLMLVVIASVVAAPLAWYFLSSWLEHYSYRIGISWWIITISCLGAIMITLATVSYQAIHAALTNPAKSLRTE